ncbi:MAG: hypothetical protein ACK5OS_08365 [Chryseotalea sp.]|jgi:hypothetical protein|nr:hypothetical protein [Flammeovirgaceae bacterium]
MRILVICAVFVLLSCYSFNGNSQSLTDILIDNNWYWGSVVLTDNTKLEGLINYNANTGIIRFQQESISKSLTARNVISFEYTDSYDDKRKRFFSLGFYINNKIGQQPVFFEVMGEYTDFALLVRADPVELNVSSNRNSHYFSVTEEQENFQYLETEQKVRLYLFESKSDVLHQICVERSRFFEEDIFDKERKKVQANFVGHKFLKTWMGEKYRFVEKYRRKNKLKYRFIADAVKILDYYASIR